MPKKIDHEERKVRILKTALDVFAREGYRDSNLSLIAEQCGLSRPTIYQYFKDKNEIFYYAVKLVTGRMFTRYATVAWDESCGDTIQRIEWICNDVIDEAVRKIRPCDIDKVSNHIFTLLEAFCFQIAFLGNFSAEDSKDFVATYLDAYRVHKG